MSDITAGLEDFREETRAWLEANFPASLKGKGLEAFGGMEEIGRAHV